MKNSSLFFTGHTTFPWPAPQAFVEAFISDPEPSTSPNVTAAWVEQAGVAIDALIEFRNAVHRWHARGQVPDAEFIAAAERLRLARLAGWFDHLIAAGLAVDATAAIKNTGAQQ